MRLTYRKRTTAAGNVEICFGNRWSKLCSGSFGEKELSVACRALGFTLFERSTVSHRFIPTTLTVSAAVFERILNCSGFERHFSECTVGAAPVLEDSNICRDLHIECLGRYVAGFRNHAGIHILVAWAPCCCPGVTAAPPTLFFNDASTTSSSTDLAESSTALQHIYGGGTPSSHIAVCH